MHQTFETPDAPLPIGPYAQVIKAGNVFYISGQIPLSPATGELTGNDLASQTSQVLDNLKAILKAVDCTPCDLVKTTVYMTDLSEFTAFNRIYAKWLGSHRPARSTVQVAALPKGALIEIEAIAVKENYR